MGKGLGWDYGADCGSRLRITCGLRRDFRTLVLPEGLGGNEMSWMTEWRPTIWEDGHIPSPPFQRAAHSGV